MQTIEFINGGIDILGEVEPLWKKLNEHHKVRSTHFIKRFDSFTFSERRKKFENESIMDIMVDLARDAKNGLYVGCCISLVNRALIGEIDTLYVEPEYRGVKLGYSLMERSIRWQNEKGAVRKILGVGVGNEEVLEFYGRFSFQPRTIILEEIYN